MASLNEDFVPQQGSDPLSTVRSSSSTSSPHRSINPIQPLTQQSLLLAIQRAIAVGGGGEQVQLEIEALLKGYCESKTNKGISRIGVEAKLGVVEKAMVGMLERQSQSQSEGYGRELIACSVNNTRQALNLPPSKIFSPFSSAAAPSSRLPPPPPFHDPLASTSTPIPTPTPTSSTTIPPLSTLVSTQAGVLLGLQTERAREGDRQYARDLLWGYLNHKIYVSKVPPLVVKGKMGLLEREMVRLKLFEFAEDVQEVRRQHSLSPSQAFTLTPNTVLPSPSHPRPKPSTGPFETLIKTQEGVLSGLASNRALERGGYVLELLKGYAERKRRSGNTTAAVGAKLSMLEREMLRLGMSQFASDVHQTRLLLSLPPSQVFVSSDLPPTPVPTSNNPRPSAYASRRPPVVRAPPTTDGLAELEGGGAPPPEYEANDSNLSRVAGELEAALLRERVV